MGNKQIDQISSVRNFIEANKLKQIGGPIIMAKAIIEYNFSGKSESDTGEITIAVDTYNYGKIGIDSDKFNPEDVHTEFLPNFQDMIFDESANKLIIKGSSPKMGGKYIVSLVII